METRGEANSAGERKGVRVRVYVHDSSPAVLNTRMGRGSGCRGATPSPTPNGARTTSLGEERLRRFPVGRGASSGWIGASPECLWGEKRDEVLAQHPTCANPIGEVLLAHSRGSAGTGGQIPVVVHQQVSAGLPHLREALPPGRPGRLGADGAGEAEDLLPQCGQPPAGSSSDTAPPHCPVQFL